MVCEQFAVLNTNMIWLLYRRLRGWICTGDAHAQKTTMHPLMTSGAARVIALVEQLGICRTTVFAEGARIPPHLLLMMMMTMIVSHRQPLSTWTTAKQLLCLNWK